MLKLLAYLLGQGIATARELFPPLAEGVIGLPRLTEQECEGSQCNACGDACPTDAITVVSGTALKGAVSIDLGSCIGCNACVAICPTATIANDPSTKTARTARQNLVKSNLMPVQEPSRESAHHELFGRSLAVRVVSTGCSACDMEISAAGNPIFDMERFGVHVVASPRFADALMVTGPVPKAMHEPLRRCYEAMAEPRLVIAAGTCAISGGVHRGGYAEANGVGAILPVDVYIPGCPPHPWSIIYGVSLAMRARNRSAPRIQDSEVYVNVIEKEEETSNRMSKQAESLPGNFKEHLSGLGQTKEHD